MKLDKIQETIEELVDNIISLYKLVDNTLVIANKAINLNKVEVKMVSLDYDVDFYFSFFDSIAKYRERLKQVLTEDTLSIVNGVKNNNIFVESRIKNINSIFSKIYQYNLIKSEHGAVPLNKCLNDLFGIRIEIPVSNLKNVKRILEQSNMAKKWNAKITNASKKEYNAIHMYIKDSNYTLRWEIQFWLRKHDRGNRDSHAKYKQSYTNWESQYGKSELFEVVDNGEL